MSLEPRGDVQVERHGPLEIWRLPETGLGPFDLVMDGGALWLTLYAGEGTGPVGIGRVDTGARTFSRMDLPAGMIPYTLRLAPDGALWVADYEFAAEPRQRFVIRIDPDALAAEAYPLPDPNDGVTDFAFPPDGSVWLANYNAGGLLRLDPLGGTVDRLSTPAPADSTRTAFTGALRLALDGDGTLWAVESAWNRLARVRPGAAAGTATPPAGGAPAGDGDPGTAGLELLSLPLGFTAPVGIVVQGDTVWTTEHPGSRLLRWRPGGQAEAVHLWPTDEEGYPVAGPNDLVEGRDGSIWAVVHFVGRLARVLPGDGTVNEFFLPPVLGLPPTRVLPLWGEVAGDGSLWTAAYGADALVRVDPDPPAARVEVEQDAVDVTAGGGPVSVRLQITFEGPWPEEGAAGQWRALVPALAGEDLPDGIAVEAEPREITARPGDSVAVTLTLTADRRTPPGEYPVVAGARNRFVAAHQTLTLRVAPARSLTGTVAMVAGVALLWILALATALRLTRRGARPGGPQG
nr:hypothetical protein [Bacillota bacterium]